MANEICLTASLTVNNPSAMSSPWGRAANGQLASMAGKLVSIGTILVATGGTAIPLGQMTAPAWAWLTNMDATNFIRIANGSAGAKLLKLKAGVGLPVCFDDTATPYAFADTAACYMEYAIFML